jgi:hypothetical protein
MKQELQTVKAQKPQKFYDDRYVESYLDDPKAGKKSALLKAGYVGEYATQEACRIHNRLRERIKLEMDTMVQDGGDIGFNVLMELAKDTETSASVRAMAAKNLLDYAGRKPSDTITIKKELSIEEIDAELELLEANEAQRITA